jgi:hypothetical protein
MTDVGDGGISTFDFDYDASFFNKEISWLNDPMVETPEPAVHDLVTIGCRKQSPVSESVDIISRLYNHLIGSPMTSNISMRGEIGTLAQTRVRDRFAQRSASLILQNLRTFPEKMLDRDDLPFFIHSQRQHGGLPEPLVICTRICQMFSTRTPDILPFIFRCIRTEQLRYLQEVNKCS